jgi:hypothetical protein
VWGRVSDLRGAADRARWLGFAPHRAPNGGARRDLEAITHLEAEAAIERLGTVAERLGVGADPAASARPTTYCASAEATPWRRNAGWTPSIVRYQCGRSIGCSSFMRGVADSIWSARRSATSCGKKLMSPHSLLETT